MTIKELTTKSGKLLPVILDNNGKLINEVYKYMRYLIINGNEKNTVLSYCQRLKLFYEWLALVNMTYLEVVEKASDSNAGIVENLIQFKLWLKFGDYKNAPIPINGFEAIRSSKTINTIMSTVLCFYDYLSYEDGLDKLNVYKEIRSNSQFHGFLSEMTIKHQNRMGSIFHEKEIKQHLKYITREQYELCYQNATNLRNKIIVSLLFETGLRISEVIGLKLCDLRDIHERKIYVKNHHDMENRDAAVKYDSEGSVFITPRMQADIIEYINTVLIDIDTNYFIINLYGDTKYQPMSRRNIEDMFEKLGKKVGIANLHPHMLRHGLAVDMLKHGCTMVQIKDTLRHQNIATTSNIYAEYDEETRKHLMDEYHKKLETKFVPEGMASIDELMELFINDDESEDY